MGVFSRGPLSNRSSAMSKTRKAILLPDKPWHDSDQQRTLRKAVKRLESVGAEVIELTEEVEWSGTSRKRNKLTNRDVIMDHGRRRWVSDLKAFGRIRVDGKRVMP